MGQMSSVLRIACDVSDSADLRSVLPEARRLGFDGATLAARSLRPDELSRTGRREVGRLLAASHLAGAALRFNLPGKGLTPEIDADRFLDRLRLCLELARDCGFECLACDLGAIPRAAEAAPKPRPIDPGMLGAILLPESSDAPPAEQARPLTEKERVQSRSAQEILREAGGIADRVGVPVAFGTSLARMHDLVALLAEVDCPLFGRELDPAASLDETPADLVAIEPPLLHVRGTDAHAAGGKSRPAPLGEGDAGWPDLLHALGDADYHGFITLDGPPASTAALLPRLR